MKPQIYFAVYDSASDSDYYGFEFMHDAVAEVTEWVGRGLDLDLMTDEAGDWGRLYVCSVDEDMVPNRDEDPDCDWFLLDLEDSEIRFRDIFSSWGDHGMVNINA